MKVSREVMAQHRQAILAVASRAFRARGFEGTSVADIMADAGLTHGGFYGHFGSKADLETEACSVALAAAAARWETTIADSDGALEAIVDGYLSERHRDSPAIGCALAALAQEASRKEPSLRRVFTDGIRARFDLLTEAIAGPSKKVRREKAIATMACLVGAIVLARTVDDTDLADEILDAARSSLT